jgi:signal peptidase I
MNVENRSTAPSRRLKPGDLKSLFILLVLLFSFRSAVADWNDVPTGSMKPTIMEGDRIFVNKLAYHLRVPFTTQEITRWSRPERMDIVVCLSPEDSTRLVKRVVGLPGDQMEFRNKQLYINGQPAEYEPLDKEDYRNVTATDQQRVTFLREKVGGRSHGLMLHNEFASMPNFGPMVLGSKEYFVVGDNRDNSRDSRYFGVVTQDKILGKATTVVLSVDKENRYLPRWDRFFQSLQ